MYTGSDPEVDQSRNYIEVSDSTNWFRDDSESLVKGGKKN